MEKVQDNCPFHRQGLLCILHGHHDHLHHQAHHSLPLLHHMDSQGCNIFFLDSFDQHISDIFGMSLLRGADNVRGSVFREELPLFEDNVAARRRLTKAKALKYLNGDPRSGKLRHLEHGCCANPEECRENFFAAGVESNLLLTEESNDCSKNRSFRHWFSFALHKRQ